MMSSVMQDQKPWQMSSRHVRSAITTSTCHSWSGLDFLFFLYILVPRANIPGSIPYPKEPVWQAKHVMISETQGMFCTNRQKLPVSQGEFLLKVFRKTALVPTHRGGTKLALPHIGPRILIDHGGWGGNGTRIMRHLCGKGVRTLKSHRWLPKVSLFSMSKLRCVASMRHFANATGEKTVPYIPVPFHEPRKNAWGPTSSSQIGDDWLTSHPHSRSVNTPRANGPLGIQLASAGRRAECRINGGPGKMYAQCGGIICKSGGLCQSMRWGQRRRLSLD